MVYRLCGGTCFAKSHTRRSFNFNLAATQATYETLESQDGDEVFNPAESGESTSSTFGATMNFINAIVGAGIVGKSTFPDLCFLDLFIFLTCSFLD